MWKEGDRLRLKPSWVKKSYSINGIPQMLKRVFIFDSYYKDKDTINVIEDTIRIEKISKNIFELIYDQPKTEIEKLDFIKQNEEHYYD